jgi:hypothetical protein
MARERPDLGIDVPAAAAAVTSAFADHFALCPVD